MFFASLLLHENSRAITEYRIQPLVCDATLENFAIGPMVCLYERCSRIISLMYRNLASVPVFFPSSCPRVSGPKGLWALGEALMFPLSNLLVMNAIIPVHWLN